MGYRTSLIPRPPLTAFFAAVCVFFHGCEKSCESRPGYEANLEPSVVDLSDYTRLLLHEALALRACGFWPHVITTSCISDKSSTPLGSNYYLP